MLAASALLALAAERLRPRAMTSRGPAAAATMSALDVGEFLRPARADTPFGRFHPVIQPDPFVSAVARAQESIASGSAGPTVPTTPAPGTRLTAILVADDRRVAVIDDAAVSVGDVLRDGARVSAIQPDRVYVVEKDGRWRMLTLLNRGSGTR